MVDTHKNVPKVSEISIQGSSKKNSNLECRLTWWSKIFPGESFTFASTNRQANFLTAQVTCFQSVAVGAVRKENLLTSKLRSFPHHRIKISSSFFYFDARGWCWKQNSSHAQSNLDTHPINPIADPGNAALLPSRASHCQPFKSSSLVGCHEARHHVTLYFF